jgi:hypothetical protein
MVQNHDLDHNFIHLPNIKRYQVHNHPTHCHHGPFRLQTQLYCEIPLLNNKRPISQHLFQQGPVLPPNPAYSPQQWRNGQPDILFIGPFNPSPIRSTLLERDKLGLHSFLDRLHS